ncbi:MAG: hypothetical protein ACOX6T_21795 [Myxococcales bacterium]|jgi:hypothetical protein
MRRPARLLNHLAVALIAFAVVAGSLQLGSTDGPTAHADPGRFSPYYSDDELPAYPNALEYPLGDDLSVNGVPVRLSHFTTRASAIEVRDFYLREFAARGVPTKVVKADNGGFTVAGMVAGGAAQAVVVIAPGETETDVFPSVYPFALSESELADTVPDEEVPFSDAAVAIMKFADKGQGEVVTYQEPLLPMNAALDHIKRQMSARGWSLTAAESSRKLARLEFARGGRTARINLTAFQYSAAGVHVVAEYGNGEQE